MKECIQSLKIDPEDLKGLREEVEQYTIGLSTEHELEDLIPLEQFSDALVAEGTKEYDALPIQEVWDMLGFPNRKIPGLADRVCVDPSLSPWARGAKLNRYNAIMDDANSTSAVAFNLLDHQVTAVMTLVKWTILGECGFNFDAVGMGKTIVTIAHFAVLAVFRDVFRSTHRFPGKFGIFLPRT